MWNLLMMNRLSLAKEWQPAGLYNTLGDAAKAIIAHENIPVSGIFLEIHISANDEEDDLNLFTYDGKEFLYTVKKSQQ